MRGKRLLIVDDDRSVAELIERVAQREGFDTRISQDAIKFRQALPQFDPDVILLDLVMPEEDGIELLSYLRKADCKARVVLVSGSDPVLLRCGQQLGEAYGLATVQCLRKPFKLDELRAALA